MKKIILLITFLCLIFSFSTNVYADEQKGYVQLTAYLDNDIVEEGPDVEVIISEGTEDGEIFTVYLYSVNKYKGNVTLPEGTYYLESASVMGDDNNFYPFYIDNMKFKIIKDKPAKMHFKLGIIEDELPVLENNLENEKEKNEEKDLLDIYDENGNLDQDKIDKTYKEITGKEIKENIKEFKKIEDEKENQKKEYEEKQKGRSESVIIKFISKYSLLVIIGILGIILIIIKHKKSKI